MTISMIGIATTSSTMREAALVAKPRSCRESSQLMFTVRLVLAADDS